MLKERGGGGGKKKQTNKLGNGWMVARKTCSDLVSHDILGYNDWGNHFIGKSKFTATPGQATFIVVIDFNWSIKYWDNVVLRLDQGISILTRTSLIRYWFSCTFFNL